MNEQSSTAKLEWLEPTFEVLRDPESGDSPTIVEGDYSAPTAS
jgi:hypothetical protein